MPQNTEIDQFLTRPLHKAFLVPEVYGLEQREALITAGFKTSLKTARSGHFAFRALCIYIGRRGNARLQRLQSAIKIIFDSTDKLASFEGRIVDQILPIIAPSDVTVHIDQTQRNDSTGNDPTEKALNAYLPILTRLAQISGLSVEFHVPQKERLHSPHASDGVIHIYANACPPGEYQSWYVDTAFGLTIAPASKDRPVGYGPTQGRGIVLKDADEKNLVQILEDTWYLLIPTLGIFNPLTSVQIFEQLLALGWDAKRTGKPTAQKPLPCTKFLRKARTWIEPFADGATENARNCEEEIKRLHARLAEKTRELVLWRGMEEALKKTSYSRATKKRLPKDLQIILNLPDVDRLELFEDAMHVWTRPLVIIHELEAYLAGTFVIRLNKEGGVTVWSEDSTHPDGVPHPHIAKHGGPCFGNAGTAIAKAGGEARYADAVKHVLTWLILGYTPNLATVKIEAWPKVPSMENSDATSPS
ncbi:hypothetical protein HQ487_00245 [Candidatus Uhrbacteria bacterium]|nr:hypothetical protein [Candidatus Uhrbacteria bacterium]